MVSHSNQLSRNLQSAVSPMERMITSFFGQSPLMSEIMPGMGEGSGDDHALALDISEDDQNVFVRASLPGFQREDVTIEVHDSVLSIQARRTQETEDKGERWHRRERFEGSVSRRISLPSQVEDDKAKAELKDGVLTLTLPKSEKAMPRKISID